jgi:1-deoxy-D-xylulose-5-phosphate reductoisomerase
MIAVRHLTILGSTGSIGVSTLDVVSRHPDRFRIVALAANKSAKKMLEQCLRFQPRYAVLLEEASAEWLRT